MIPQLIAISIVLLAGGLVIPRLGRRSAAERHLAWMACLSAASLQPLLAIVLPSWRPEWASRAIDILTPAFLSGIASSPADEGADVIIRAIGLEASSSALSDRLPFLWLAGAAIMLMALAAHAIRLARLSSSAERVGHGTLAAIANEVARDMGVTRPVTLLQSARELVPMTWGLWRPRVLLPAGAAMWSDERARVVLAHELAHVRRRDWLIQMCAEIACAVYWFHPLVWFARHRLCRESEQAADDLVINLGVEASDYAAHLLDIIRATRMPSRWAPTVAMAQRSSLEQRFRALLLRRANRRGVTRWTAVAVAAGALLLALPLAASRRSSIDWTIDLYTDNPSGMADAAVVPSREAAGSAVRAVRAVRLTEPSARLASPEITEYTTPPLYSEEARTQRLEGIVTIAAHVEADGRVSGTRLVRGLGAGLDQNAMVAVRQWRFRPGTRAGAPIAMWAEIDVEFSLRSDAVNALIANDMATRVGPGVTPPRAIRVFELWNRRAVKPGSIVLDFVLLEDGTPRIVRILKSLDPTLDESAMRNFERWRFSPAMKDGMAVKVRMNAEVRFK